jgi:ribonuclease III
LERKLGYQFAQPALLSQALSHRSVGAPNNERLEFLGDAWLGFVIAEALVFRYVQADEGQLSRLRSGLVKQETLASIARELELGDYLNLGAGELRTGGYARDSILADALEAVFAAVYLDGGADAARSLVLRLYEARLQAIVPERPLKDPKTRLQELLQARHCPVPDYTVLEVWGSPHDQSFRVSCQIIEPPEMTEGSGGSRRRAEQQAAQLMLERLGIADSPSE